MCILLSPKLLQLFLLAVDLTTVIPIVIILLSMTFLNFNVCKIVWQRSPCLLVSLTQYHFLNHCIGSPFDITLFLRSVQLPTKHFHPSNKHIYIHCSLLHDSPDSFDHLILIYFLFPVLRHMSERELFQLLADSVELTPFIVLNL